MRNDIKINDRALALQDKLSKLEKVLVQMWVDVYNLGLIYEIEFG